MARATKIKFGDYLNVTDEGGGVIRVDGCPPAESSFDSGGSPTGLSDILLGHELSALWKLDETAGLTAHDSSGNGNDLTAGSGAGPTWAQPVGPPATVSELPIIDVTRFSATLSAFTDDFSAGTWLNIPSDPGPGNLCEFVGQGQFLHYPYPGWGLFYDDTNHKLGLQVGTSLGYINSAISYGVWYLFGFTISGGVSTMYLNGLAQTSTLAGTATATTTTWVNNCGYATADHGSNAYQSWSFLINEPLTAGDWLEIAQAPDSLVTLPSGRVWTSDGAGSASWQFASTGGSGVSADRPFVTTVGTSFWDTTLGKPIWWNGSVWKDATGTTV